LVTLSACLNWVSAGSDRVIFSFFMLRAEGILPSVSERDIAVDQTRWPLDWVYHLLVNSVLMVPVFVEFGRITKSLSP